MIFYYKITKKRSVTSSSSIVFESFATVTLLLLILVALIHVLSTTTIQQVDCYILSPLLRRQQYLPVQHIRQSSSSTSILQLSPSSTSSSSNTRWEVYVDQSKSALEKGAGATLDAFVGLTQTINAAADQNNDDSIIQVLPAIISKTKAKAPAVRCISSSSSSSTNNNDLSFDVSNVDSVDKVFRILTKHMKIKGISMKTCECLKWKYKGNGHLESGKVSLAIDCYDKALSLKVQEQEGIIRLMRATAYLKRASAHREKLKIIVQELTEMVPSIETLHNAYKVAYTEPVLANIIFRKILNGNNIQESTFRKTQYRHGLYQYALLQAAQDSLIATQLLPTYANAWQCAGEILAELWKLKESAQYYAKAVELDEKNLSPLLSPVITRLRKRQELLDNARAYGWSEDTLRLALDVAR